MKYDWCHQTAIAVAKAESGLRPDAHNYNPATGDNSYGIFQINLYGSLANSRPAPNKLVDYKFNVEYAYNMWKSQGWTPWGAYTNGSYLNHM